MFTWARVSSWYSHRCWVSIGTVILRSPALIQARAQSRDDETDLRTGLSYSVGIFLVKRIIVYTMLYYFCPNLKHVDIYF